MSGNFDSLRLLDPLLLDSLTKDEFLSLASELQKESCLSEDTLRSLSKFDSDKDYALAVVNAVFENANPGLDMALVMCLKRIGKHKVAKIVECLFDPNERQRVAWILHSWNELLKHEKHIKDSLCFLTTKKLSDKHWLLDFCFFAASDDSDSEAKTKFIEMLQTSVSDSDGSLMDTAGFEFLSMGSIKTESTHAPCDAQSLVVQNFEISSTSSSDSKENYAVAPSRANQELSDSSPPKASQSSTLQSEEALPSDQHSVDSLPKANEQEQHLSSHEVDDVEMADESSSIGVISESAEDVHMEDVDMNDIQLQLHSPPHNSKDTVSDDADRQDTLVTIHQDVERTLFPLMPLFESCLSEKDMRKIAKDMFADEHLTRETFEKLKKMQPETIGMYLIHFIQFLREEANENWKKTLLDSFEDHEKTVLLQVVDQYFGNKNEDLSHLIVNSESLQNRKEDLLQIAEQLGLEKSITEHEEDWLLHFIHQTLLANGDTVRKVVVALQKMDEPQDQPEVVDEQSPKNPAERIDGLLNPLMPLLKSNMNGKEIVGLAKELAVLDYCSTGKFKEFRSLTASISLDETFTSFVDLMKNDAKDNWEDDILKAIEERGLATLHDVVACYFEQPNNFSFFLNNWDTLQEREEELFGIAQKLDFNINVDKQAQSWLLSYLHEIIKLGNEALLQLVAALTADQTSQDPEQKVPKTPADEIEDLLKPLLPLLKSCMSGKEIVGLAKELAVLDYFSTGTFKKFRSTSASSADEDETFSSFVDLMKDDAKENWDDFILKAIEERGLTVLHAVVAYYFENPNVFSWILNNWDSLQENEEQLHAAAQKLNFHINFDKQAKSWLLCYLHEIIKLGDDALLQLVAALTPDQTSQDPEKEIPKTPADRIDVLLKPLLPLLKSSFSGKDIVGLVKDLALVDYCSTVDFKEFRSFLSTIEEDKAYISFINFMKGHAQENWEEVFLEVLHEGDHAIAYSVIAFYFKNLDLFSWFLQNWDVLFERKEIMISLIQKLNYSIAFDEKCKSWLLFYLCEIIKLGDKALLQLRDALDQEQTSRPTYEHQEETHEDAKNRFLKDIEESLVPLLWLFKSNIELREFTDIVAELCVDDNLNITKDSLASLRESIKAGRTYEDVYTQFINCVIADGKDDWKTAFLEALKAEGQLLLCDIVSHHFHKPHSITYFLENWETLLSRKDEIIVVAQKFNICINQDNKDDIWLLDFLNTTIEQEDILQQIIEALREEKQADHMLQDKASVATEVSGAFEKDVEYSLLPLIQLLTFCLPPAKLIAVAEDMSLEPENSLAKDSVELLKVSADTAVDHQDTVQLFINYLKNQAQAKWQESFLTALRKEGLETLSFVVQKYLLYPAELYTTAFSHWKAMEARKQDLIELATQKKLCADLNVESDDIVLLIIWNAMARGTQCMERIVEMFSPSHKKDAVPAAPQSRPLVKQAEPEKPLTRSQAKKLRVNAEERIEDVLSTKQVQLDVQTQSPKYVSTTNVMVGGSKPGDTPPQAPPRRTSFGKTKQAKYFAAPGEPSISESEESLKETSLTSSSDGEPPKIKPRTYPDKTVENPKSPQKDSFTKTDDEDDEEYSLAPSDPGGDSYVMKTVQDFEILGDDIPKLKDGTQKKGAAEKEDMKKKRLFGRKNEQKQTYAGVTGKDSKAGGKKKQQIQKPSAPVKAKSAVNQEFSSARLQKLPYGHCLIEFRARFPEGSMNLPEGSTLFLYLDNPSDRGHYPMEFNSTYEEYRITLSLYAGDTFTYKYCILNERGMITNWEHLIYHRDQHQTGIHNRQWTLKPEQKNSRYCVKFDVVVFQLCSIDEYKNLLVNTHYRFLHCEFDLKEENKDENALMQMHYVYRNWFIDQENGLVTQKQSYSYMDQPSRLYFRKDTKVNAILSFLCALVEIDDVPTRVLSALAFVTALHDKVSLEEDDGIIYQICTSLSIHKITDEDHGLFATQLMWFHQIWFSMKKQVSLLGHMEKLHRKLAKVPESLLVFPIIKMLQSMSKEAVDPKTPPTMNYLGTKYMKQEWESAQNQKVIMEMGKKVLLLLERFPWIKKSYSSLITVRTAAYMLVDETGLATLIDTDIAFFKLIEFWNTVASKSPKAPEFNEKVVTVLSGYIATKVDQAFKSERQESDEICARKWLAYVDALFKSCIQYVCNNSRQCNVGSVAFMLTLIDEIVVFAQAVKKFAKSDADITIRLNQCVNALVRAPGVIFESTAAQTGITDKEIELWNTLLDYKWNAQDIAVFWKFNCEDALKYSLKRKFDDPEDFVNFYAEEFEAMKPTASLVKCFTEVLTTTVEDNVGAGRWYDAFLSKPSLIKVIWKIFKKKWFLSVDHERPIPRREESILLFFEQWTPASFFVCKLCAGWKNANKRISHKKAQVMTDITRSNREIILSLYDGTITVSRLMMLENVENFWECYDTLWTFDQYMHGGFMTGTKYCSKAQFDKLLKLRLDEFAAFHNVQSHIEGFVKLATLLKKDGIDVDCSTLIESLGVSLPKMELKTLVECKDPHKNVRTHKVKHFPISPDDLEVVTDIMETNCLNCVYAKTILIETARNCDSQQFTIDDFVADVWTPAYANILETANKLHAGSITFKEVDQLLKNGVEATNEDVNQQVKIMFEMLQKAGVDTDNMQLRSDQINNYLVVLRQQKTAQVLLDIKRILKLKGRFDAIKNPLNEERRLDSITADTLKSVSSLEDITAEQLKVLRYFRRGELLSWVKQHMKDLGEVKVMSDLAMISAGETPMEVDRVSCFLSAVMGFSPIIFDLPQDAGLKQLLEACKKVWENVERDKRELYEREDDQRRTLLQKWVDTNKQIEWLKRVTELRGSVEKSSLARAQQINKCGTYIIGKEKEKISNVENCLRLIIPENSKKKEPRVEMSLSELHDLQSRLMLIAGEADKGKDDVTRFIDVLSSAESLAKAYVQLKLSGCLLFNDWFAMIRCWKELTERSVTIEVSFDQTSSKVASSCEVLQEIKELTDVLQFAHKKWMDYLFEKRNEHYHLNHYNIHQLTYLCKKLSCVEGNDFPDQVYQLLAGVASNLNYADISDCLEDVTRIDDEPEQADMSVIQDDNAVDSRIDKKKRVIRKLVQLELSEKVAKAAVQCVPSLDVDECYLWALENGNEESIIAEQQKSFDEEVAFGTSNTDIKAIQDVINDRLNLTLAQVISRILQNLENSNNDGVAVPVKTVCERYFGGTAVTSLEDCISLEHLGQFLAMIANLSADQMKLPKREIPEGFHTGKPNLIVCPKVDMWRTILSIYMTSADQGLPSAAEVLVCCESTTTEEVELLLRRAMQTPADDGKRIFCLACADEVDFNVAKNAETLYQQLNQMSDRNNEFRLVVLATSLYHYLTSLFDEYRVDVTFMADVPQIKEFICNNLSTHGMIEDTASVIDHNRNLVRLVSSDRAGMGKSLYVRRRYEKLAEKFQDTIYWDFSTIRFLEKDIDVDDTIDILTHSNGKERANVDPHFVHIDITPAVRNGVYKFLFDLIILGELKSSDGVIWRRRHQHFYALEYTFPSTQGQVSFSNLLTLLPSINCISPVQVMDYLQENVGNPEPNDQILMDRTLLHHEMYQRPFQYLLRFTQKLDLDRFSYKVATPDALNCLKTLLQYCSIDDPSWSELSHFSKFLNTQLHDCENSYYLNMEDIEGFSQREAAQYKIFGFKQFAVRFMIRMSQDFATPSLKINEGVQDEEKKENDVFELHQLRRRWENDFHPYLFFNADRISFSFVHFNISDQGHLCNPKTDAVVEPNIMNPQLVKDLKNRYKVKVRQDFDRLSRQEKLETLCNVFGVHKVFDPDSTYELTTDNVLKMLAIHMRFRCGIPVVIMGETGCGKTRMVDFMSRLKRGGDKEVQNMVVVKVHGGITVAVIQKRVKKAVKLARLNLEKNLETILFLDEANTTEAIYAIKEIVCDATVHGEPFAETGLKIVAACNPYRKHDDNMIERMEQSGLGFHVKTEDVTDTFAGIPMRHLVYRVIPLPPSMQPLVWDFGQLNNSTEEIYIKQMVLKLQGTIEEDENLEDLHTDMVDIITNCLSASQKHMRDERDVCSFVSLRDVERTIITFRWFYRQLPLLTPLIVKAKNKGVKKNFTPAIQALIHALGVCYHVTLDDREKYRNVIAAQLLVDQEDIANEITACQNVFINAIELEKDIGRNEALTENVFMMVVCAELRIPLFLVGKPGSSKSLAKTIVTDAMQGRNSKTDLFKKLKQIHVSSFQCSAVSDAVGIERVFNQCALLQKNQSLDEFVAVVVLDEIGLAEDSPKMPLKVLHPLLENASTNTQLAVDPHSKVGFVGISNWALDPAKMNRGIFVTRGKPSEGDLQKTAEAIFESDKEKIKQVSNGVIRALTSAYLHVYEKQDKEFFGLRDYYGLLKMLCGLVTNKNEVFFGDIAKLVLRNFSGYKTDTFRVFKENLVKCFPHVYNLEVPVIDLIRENLTSDFESRFLLLLTNQYAAVSLLPKVMDFSNLEFQDKKIKNSIQDYQVIFGSSFPRDNDYTEVCRNINRIKVCMETGRTVVLLNLRDLYESLYDALNQHYVTFAGQRYVDLGLGGHRVKCRIATNFRLIVIEEKEVVYKNFPIPLINRLEKHVFEMNSVLSYQQTNLVNQLIEWIERFTTFKRKFALARFSKEDTFPGYTNDTPASAFVSSQSSDLHSTKKILLQTASLDGICRLPKTSLTAVETASHMDIYMKEQNHDTLLRMLQEELKASHRLKVFEITSFSQILHDKDRIFLENELSLTRNSVMLLTLQQFQTERNFSERLDKFFESVLSSPQSAYVLLIQCPQAQLHGNLIACAKYATMNKVKEFQSMSSICDSKVLVLFLFTMERNINAQNGKASFTSFHSQNCDSLYIDELKPSRNYMAPVSDLWNVTISNLILQALNNIGPMNRVLDLERLVRDSIPEAIAKLKNEGRALRRNRIRILNELCFKSEFSSHFLTIMGNHIWYLMRDREKQSEDKEFWIVDVACSPEALQETGSFKHAVWLHLRKLTATAIAKVVSLLDSDDNLDVVSNSGMNEFWLQIFDSPSFFALHWPDTRFAPTFYVKTQFKCSFPFFRLFFEHFHKQWLIVEQRNYKDKRGGFFTAMDGSKTLKLLDLISGPSTVLFSKEFIHDLVCYLHKSRSDNIAIELETIENCVFNVFQALREEGSACNNAIVEVYLLYKEIQPNLQQFSSVIAVSSDILMKDHLNWVDEQLKHSKFVAHKLALASLVKKLHDEAPKSIDAVDTCEKWKALVNKAKPVAYGLVLECSEEIQQMWTRIVFVEIFLDQLVPTSASPENVQKYLATIAPSARRLSIGARKFDQLSHLQFMNIITKALEGCIKEIETRLLCKWQDIKCRSCKANRMIDPVLLPCKHFVCLKCIPAQQAADRSCAKCRTKIPEDFELRPVVLNQDQTEELKKFQSACTSFFLEYLSTFCFPNMKPPLPIEEKMLDLVLERLVICDTTVQKKPGVLTDFGLDFVARSFILQLVIGNNLDYVETKLNNHLQAIRNEFQTKALLFDVYIHCDRNILQTEIESLNEDGADDTTDVDFALQLFYKCAETNTKPFNQIQHLDFSVKMQFIVQMTVSSIHALHHDKENNLQVKQMMTRLVRYVCELCNDNKFDMIQRAIVKELCQKHGMEAFNILAEKNDYCCLIPLYLRPDGDEGEVNLYLESDMLVLCGSSYQNTKTMLHNVKRQDDFPEVFQGLVHEIQQSPDSIFQILLSLSVWTGRGAVGKLLRRETFKHMTEKLHTHFAGKSYQQTFSDIAENKLTCPKHDGMSDQMHHKLTELLTVFCVTTLWRNDGLLADFVGLINDSKQYAKAFLPTMPASSYFQVKDLLAKDIGAYGLAPKAFLCPNGHLYFIGDCTRANQSARCPDCRQPIGGQAYDKLHAGNVAGDITEESQAGYKLKAAKDLPAATPERSLSKLSVCALRFCLHAAMLLGCRNGNTIHNLIGNQNPSVSVFLVQHLVKDLTDLAEFLGKSIDDAVMIMHEIFRKMRLTNIPIDQKTCNLKSMKAREMWEKEFQLHYLTIVFKEADNIINKAKTTLVNAGNMQEKPLESLVYELDLNEQLPEGIVKWDCPYLWKSRKYIDIKHLNQKLEAVDASVGGEGAVLKTILNMEDLHFIQYLDVILELQSIVMGKYKQKIDLLDAEQRITLNDFLTDDEFVSESKVDIYVGIWNKVRLSLAKQPSYKPLLKYFDEAMNYDSPIAMCIPSKRKRGRCAYVLVEYLIEKQNFILQQCRDHIKPKPKFSQIDAAKLTKKDIVTINKKKDLMSLIQANHQYETSTEETGPSHKIVYDFGLLEKKIVEKFISRKAEIKFETVPLMQYPQDVGLAKDCDAVEQSIKQVPLPVRMCHDIDRFVENARTANICEAVRTITIVIQFLAKLGAEPDQTICNYAERELLLPPEETEMIPLSALISHCLALYERLSWHRSKRLIQNGQNPFENVLEHAESIKDEELEEHLKEELKGMNIERLQLELNAVMMVGPEMQPDWSLGSEVLLSYLDIKYEDADNSWCERIPEEILFKHAAHVFELSMELVEN